jgi:hypothetical protein
MPDDTTTFTDNAAALANADHAADERNTTSIVPSNTPFGDIGVGNVKAALRLHGEIIEVLHDIGRDWVARATSEAEFAFALPNRLSAAQTIPDAFTAYQQWLNEWMSLCGEDGRRLFADGQRVMDKSARCFAAAAPGATT